MPCRMCGSNIQDYRWFFAKDSFRGIVPATKYEKPVIIFIIEKIIKPHLNYNIHRVANILQIGKKRAKLS
jgi:hypothetical protein